jgi:hypothetical protein
LLEFFKQQSSVLFRGGDKANTQDHSRSCNSWAGWIAAFAMSGGGAK